MADLADALVDEKQQTPAARMQNIVEILLSRAEGEPTLELMVWKRHFNISLMYPYTCYEHNPTIFVLKMCILL